MKALVIGASGATGKDLVNVLLEDSTYTEVSIFVRRSLSISHPKLKEIITDFKNMNAISDSIRGEVWFSCIGTTLKAAGSKEAQRKIDYEIPSMFAEIAKKNGIQKAVLLSAYGASSKSKVFYSKMKGELEDKIASLGFIQYIIFRPGLLLRKDSDRFGEKLSESVLNFFNALGILKKFKPMPTTILAQKMAKSAAILPDGKHEIELDKIFNL